MTVTTPLGQVLRDADGLRLEFVRTYAAPVEDVWSALTEADRVARWYGRWTGDPTTGTVEVVMTAEDDPAPETVTIVTCQPPSLLVVDMPSPDGTWRVSVALEAGDGDTRLRFVQRLAEPYDASDIGPGWHFYLDRFGCEVAGRDAVGTWDHDYPSLSDAYTTPS